MTPEDVVARLRSGMTIGIGGWGSRRKPMALVRALLRSDVTDLTVVAYGGPDVGLLAAAGKIRKLVTAFVTLDSIPLEPHFREARQRGAFELTEVDEAMFMWGLHAAANRLPFIPVRAGIGSDVMRVNPALRTVDSPYEDGETLVAMPALRMDAALVHMNRADRHGNGQYLGPDPYFDDLFCEAADTAYVSCEELVEGFGDVGDAVPQTLLVKRHAVTGVVETPNGAHFTSCAPDYGRDEAFQKLYATTPWPEFAERFLPARGDEKSYQEAVRSWHAEQQEHAGPATGAATRAPAPVPETATTPGTTTTPTRAEYCVIACADAWRDSGEILASPMGLIPSVGARLAKRTFSPDLLLTDGEAMTVGLGGEPEGWLPYRQHLTMVTGGRRHVMMGASQIDRHGNQNISCIGDWDRPDRQLLGVRGAPVNTLNNPVSYWIPKHSARVFVEKVDMISGVGYDSAAAAGPSATRYHRIPRVVSNLGVFDFETPDRSMRLASVHPGVTVDEVIAATGFPLALPDGGEVPQTREPTPEELRLIREVIDPKGLRDREVRPV